MRSSVALHWARICREAKVGRRCMLQRGLASPSRLESSQVDRLDPDLEELLEVYCNKLQTRSSLQMLMDTGGGDSRDGSGNKSEAFRGRMGQRLAMQRVLISMSDFLRRELPIRLAHRIRDLDQVPMLRDMKTIQEVKGIYIKSFQALLEEPRIETPKDEEEFAERLENLYTKHSSVLVQIAKGAFELRKSMIDEGDSDPENFYFDKMDECHKFLDRFYMSRIGIRVLAGQYLALRERKRDDYIGMICLKTSPYEIVQKAARDVQRMCLDKYRRTPQFQVSGRLDLTFPYIPTYLHYILLELLKNAMRATAEHHKHAKELPIVSVIIADGMENEDVVIQIADEGGGIPRSQMNKVWSYLFTTADTSLQEAMFYGKDHSRVSPIAGLGYGLPISRSYIRYFGGDIDVMSMEGYGTDVFVYLKRLSDSKEPVPV